MYIAWFFNRKRLFWWFVHTSVFLKKLLLLLRFLFSKFQLLLRFYFYFILLIVIIAIPVLILFGMNLKIVLFFEHFIRSSYLLDWFRFQWQFLLLNWILINAIWIGKGRNLIVLWYFLWKFGINNCYRLFLLSTLDVGFSFVGSMTGAQHYFLLPVLLFLHPSESRSIILKVIVKYVLLRFFYFLGKLELS